MTWYGRDACGVGFIASLAFLPTDPTTRIRSLRVFEEAFQSVGLEILRYREGPVDDGVPPFPSVEQGAGQRKVPGEEGRTEIVSRRMAPGGRERPTPRAGGGPE